MILILYKKEGETPLRAIERYKKENPQKEIIEKWKDVLSGEKQFKILKLKAVVSSGTYIRSLAEYLGKKLGTGALAYRIKRIRVGKFSG